VRAAVDAQGHVLAMDDEFFHSQGAYVRTHGARVPELTSGMLSGPYSHAGIPQHGAFPFSPTRPPAATYRAPGRYEGSFVRERLMDAVAAKLHLDSHRSAAAQSDRQGADAVRARLKRTRYRCRARFGRLCRLARQDVAGDEMGRIAKHAAPPPREG